MSGGRHALKGFEYQATVNLYLVLKHFFDSSQGVSIRPEGEDDLVVFSSSGVDSDYYQVKKPKEFDNGELKNEPWTLNDVIQVLLIGSYDRLKANNSRQFWVLGDDVSAEVNELVASKSNNLLYLRALHTLARDDSGVIPKDYKKCSNLLRWFPNKCTGIAELIQTFRCKAVGLGIPHAAINEYAESLTEIHKHLPSVLTRISIKAKFGLVEDIRAKTSKMLIDFYGLDWEIVKDTLIPGLRNYLYGISTSLNKVITKADFEAEVRTVWPKMTLVCEPPIIKNMLKRDSIVKEILKRSKQGPLEIIGGSGSGKTTIAKALFEEIKYISPSTRPLYLEVRHDTKFKDVLIGIAFHLRAFGNGQLFPLVVNYKVSDERAIIEFAENCSLVDTFIIIDLVEGGCSDHFARDIERFLENLSNDLFKLIIMGQDSSFRMLSGFQKKTLKLPDLLLLPGLSFEEFIKLMQLVNPGLVDRNNLFKIYNRLTASRSSGLYVQDACSIAEVSTFDDMEQLSAMPPSEFLKEAAYKKYSLLSDDLKPAADQLLCFLLPFSIDEAVKLFPDKRIKEAIKELNKLGLLTPLTNNRYEFHETTRKGLEEFIPIIQRHKINEILADYYNDKDDISAAVYHFERAGEINKAHDLCRQSFLTGNFRGGLSPYLLKNKLISEDEIVELLINEDEVSKHYMLPEMLRGMGNTETANVLLKYAKNNTVKFKENYQWAWRMVEAILICEPTMVEELISFGLDGKINDNGKEDRLERVIQGICIKSQPVIKPSAMSFFMKLPSKVQYRLIPVFFKDKRREVLTPIMQFIYEKQANIDSKIYLNQLVKFNNSDEINEFLASIPMPSTHGKMLLHNSILFGILESIIWKEQNTIRSQCISVFEQNCTDEKILLNALRVLVFLQDDRCLTIAKQIPFKKDSFLSTFAGFIPLFFKHKVDFEEYRMRVLDVELDNEIRLQAFFVLSAAGIDIGQTLDELEKIDEGSANIWDFSALMFSIQNPSKRVIPIFEKSFEDSPENNPFLILINRFGELDGDDVTDFLLRMLRSRLSEANILACLSLQNRRDKRALPALLSLIRESNDVQIVQTALVAAIASGPDNINEFMDIWERFPESYLWRCVLIGRLRASSDADWLCEIAIDKNQHWQLRRTAVMAASRLPFELALEKIYLTIMGEESSFKIDNHPSLIMHNIIAPLVLKEGGALLRFYLRGEDAFVDFWGDLFKEMSQGASYPAPEGSEKSTATWLFHKLTEEGFPKNQSAQDSILNDLHIPIVQASILRGFRLCNRIDLIEKYIMEANSEWLLLRSICEWAKHNYTDADIDRLKKLVAKTSFQSSVCVKNVLSNISRPIVSKTSQSDIYKTFQTCNLEPRVTLHFQDIIDAIDSGRFKYDENYSIENMSKDKFIYLVNELNPSNDYKISHDINEPAIGFGESGPLIKEMKPISISANNENKVRKYLRTLIATFNKYEVDIPWHKSLLSGGAGHHDHIAYEYGLGFLRLLGKQGNMDMFYSELEKYHYDILPRMDKYLSDPLVKCLIDDRIVPYLRRYVNAGTDKMLLSVCSLASYLDSPAVDQVLSDLFYRWYNKFDRASKDTQHNNNRELWQSFNILKKHPRFKVICDYDLRLLEILDCNLPWYKRDDIIDVIKESPRSYIKIETLLRESAQFEHYLNDEVDRLDSIAEGLFTQYHK